MSDANKFTAVWYDRNKVYAWARKRGWNGTDSLLDSHHPDEYESAVASYQRFATRDDAVAHLRNIINNNEEFWGQATVREFEVVPAGKRCDYCTCSGNRLVREYGVDETGIVDTTAQNDCAYADDES